MGREEGVAGAGAGRGRLEMSVLRTLPRRAGLEGGAARCPVPAETRALMFPCISPPRAHVRRLQ